MGDLLSASAAHPAADGNNFAKPVPTALKKSPIIITMGYGGMRIAYP
jgi:hypothetical protein